MKPHQRLIQKIESHHPGSFRRIDGRPKTVICHSASSIDHCEKWDPLGGFWTKGALLKMGTHDPFCLKNDGLYARFMVTSNQVDFIAAD